MFTEANTVEQMVLDACVTARLALCPRTNASASAFRRVRRIAAAAGADQAQPGNRRPARPRRRGDLQAAGDPALRADRRPGAGQRELRRGCAARRRCRLAPTASTLPCAWWTSTIPRTTSSWSATSGLTRSASWKSGSTWCFSSTACRWSSARRRRPYAQRGHLVRWRVPGA